jgi:general secretion pathway protein D
MSTNKSWISCFAILALLMLECIPVRELRSQTQTRRQTQEEREKGMQEAIKQLQNAGQTKTQTSQQNNTGQSKTPAAAGQTQTPDATTQTQAPAASGQAQAPAVAPAPTTPVLVQRPALSGDKVQLTYSNADLYDFIVQISEALAISPIVIDTEVKGSVTIESASPMSKDDVFPLFNIILKNNNAALVKQGNIYQIVPISSALKKGLEIIDHLPASDPKTPSSGTESAKPAESNSSAPAQPKQTSQAPKAAKQSATTATAAQSTTATTTDNPKTPRLATHVLRVEFVPVRELLEPLKVFMSEGGVIMPYERLNMLIVTDYSDSLNKIMEIIGILDNGFLDPDLIELVRMQTNDAKYVVEDLQKIFGTSGKDSASGGGVYFTALSNVNAILVMANSKRALAEVKRWIGELDASTGRSIQTYIYTVQNSTASNIALILSALYGEGEGSQTSSFTGTTGGAASTGTRNTSGSTTSGVSSGSSRSFGGTSAASGSSTSSGLFGGSSGSSGTGTYGSTMTGGAFGSGQQLGPRLNQSSGISAGILKSGEFSGLQGDVRIVVDDINNALIIQASSADYAYIIETIKKMDVLPRQVIIDARIFEVALTEGLSFGVTASLQAADATKHLTTAAINSTGALSGGTFAIVGNSRDILMNLSALQSKTKVRVLEAPSVLALDGTEAHIVVGSEVPYQGTSYISAAGGSTTSVQYRDTGVSLIVLPKISGSGTVTLTVAQEVSSAGDSGTLGPTFNKTSVDTTLAVQDGQTVAIAGLIRDSNNVNRNGVPFLASIPLIGSLFGSSKNDSTRTELIILITPHVIKTADRFEELTQDLKDSLRNVRKYMEAKDKERVEDMKDSREERNKQEEKKQKEIVPPASDKK